ncbi:hypothetical protein EPI10_026163 [Gossypium australe]|uniref:Uncharacterized protein n=1 Tax=Gossypium australe TaxID=47621 RepID=A0A5B6W4B1_9ROSI|nr:hypothetical protein EPI10_026163 [Gossypium australe]
MGHAFSSCLMLTEAEKQKVQDDLPYSLALKAESHLFGKECVQLRAIYKKVQSQSLYTGQEEENSEGDLTSQRVGSMGALVNTRIVTVTEKQTSVEEGLRRQAEESFHSEGQDGNLHSHRKGSWRRVNKMRDMEVMSKPTDCNENHKLECPWIRESTGSSEASVFAEAM